MEDTTNANQIREKELELARLLWPKLSDSPIKIDFKDIAAESGMTKGSLHTLASRLTNYGVIKRVGGRGKYSRGNPVIAVGNKHKLGSNRTVNLDDEQATPPAHPPAQP